MIFCRSVSKSHFLLVLIALLASVSAIGQIALTSENFHEEILKYKPMKRSTITEKEFNFGSMVMRETKLAVKGDPDGFNRADYYNVLVAFLSLDESDQNIQLAFEKFSKSEGACEYFSSFGKSVNEKEIYAPIRAQFNARAAECAKSANNKSGFDLDSYCSEYSLKGSLVALFQSIKLKDQQYRGTNNESHKKDRKILDIENQFTIDSLYKVHETYIGKALVGPKFESTMWAVIQHSNPEMMKKYLPVLKQAVQDGELAEAAFKMTIDRYYAIAHGYQIFGSQSGFGVELADEATRMEIVKRYGINHQ